MKSLRKQSLSATLATALGLSVAHAIAASAAPTFEMRLVVDCNPDSVSVPYEHQGASNALCLSPDLILGRDDIAGAVAIHTVYGSDAIRITIGPDGRARLTAATTAHVGGKFAILYDGKIVSVPVVREPVSGSQLEIDIGASGDSLSAMVADLRGGKPQ